MNRSTLAVYVTLVIINWLVCVSSDQLFCECEHYTAEGTICRVYNANLGTYEDCSMFVDEVTDVCGNKRCDSRSEQCDDGNTRAGDGCDECQVETHWSCDSTECANDGSNVYSPSCILDPPKVNTTLASFHRGRVQAIITGSGFTYGNSTQPVAVAIELSGAITGPCVVTALLASTVVNSTALCTLPSNTTWTYSEIVNASNTRVFATVTRVSDGKKTAPTLIGYTRDDPTLNIVAEPFALDNVITEAATTVTITGESFAGIFSSAVTVRVGTSSGGHQPPSSADMSVSSVTFVNNTHCITSISDTVLRSRGGHALFVVLERSEDGRRTQAVAVSGIVSVPTITAVTTTVHTETLRPTPLGDAQVNVTGHNFTGNVDGTLPGVSLGYLIETVTVNDVPCDTAQVVTPQLIQCTVRPGYGHGLDIKIKSKRQLFNIVGTGLFSYDSPVVSSAVPRSATQGGTLITILGKNFGYNATATVLGTSKSILLDGNTCTVPVIVNDTTMTCISGIEGGEGINKPAQVTIAGESSTNPTAFSYLPPEVTRISPFRGSTLGTNPLTLFGRNFGPSTSSSVIINLNTGTCEILTHVSHSEIRCKTPNGDPGATALTLSVGGQPAFKTQLYTYSESSEELCRNGKELDAHFKQRVIADVEYFRNIALKKNVTTDTPAIHAYLDEITDGDRCCKATDRSEGLKCALRFQPNQSVNSTYTINFEAVGYINGIRTAWPDPCRDEPRPGYLIEYHAATEAGHSQGWKTWKYRQTEIDRDAADVISQVASQTMNPCVAIRGDVLPVSLCADFFSDGVLATAVRVSFDNRELPQGSGWTYETEVNGIFLTETYALRANWTQNVTTVLTDRESVDWQAPVTSGSASTRPALFLKTALRVRVPDVDVISLNVLGRQLTTIEALNQPSINITGTNSTNATYPLVSATLYNAAGDVVPNGDGAPSVSRALSANGTAMISGVTMSSPDIGSYKLTIGYQSSSSLVHAFNLSVSIIEGDPARLRLLSTLPSTIRATQNLLLGPHEFEYTDAARNSLALRSVPPGTISMHHLALSFGNVTEEQVLANHNGTNIGSVTHTGNGRATLTETSWIRPRTGKYYLRSVSTLPGIVTTNVPVEILVGQAALIQVESALPLTTVSQALSQFSCIVTITDSADNPVGSADLLRDITIKLTAAPAIVTSALASLITGVKSVSISNGEGVLSGTQLISPKIGEYTVSLESEGLLTRNVPLRVDSGPPVALVAQRTPPPAPPGSNITSAASLLLSLRSTPLGSFFVKVIDAGGNEATSSADIPVAISTPNATTTTLTTDGRKIVIVKGRNGLEVGTLFFAAPKAGPHVIEFTNSQLAPASIAVDIVTGPTDSVSVPADVLTSFSIPFRAAKTVTLPAFRVGAFDAGGNPSAIKAGTKVAVQHNPAPAVTSVQVRNATAVTNTTRVTLLQSTKTVQIYNGVVPASGLLSVPALQLESPRLGDQSLSLTIGSFSTRIPFSLRPGPPHAVDVSPNSPDPQHTNAVKLTRPPIVIVRDEVGNAVSNETVSVSIHVIGNRTIVHGTSTVLTSPTTGEASFEDFGFQGVRGSKYQLGFSIPSLSPDVKPLYNISILPCTAVTPHAATSPDGFGCECGRGAFNLATTGDESTFECALCPAGTYKPTTGQGECIPCPTQHDTGGREGAQNATADCQCIPGYFQRTLGAPCEECPTGVSCPGGVEFVVDRSYWRPSSSVYVVYPCPSGSSACQGTISGSSDGSFCENGYDGPLCAVCKPNHAKFNGKCEECLGPTWSWIIFVIALVVALTVCVIMVKRAQRGKSDRSVVMVLVINFLQMLGLVGDLNVPWPGSTFGLFNSADSVSTIALNFHPLQCALQLSYFHRLLFYLILPLLLIGIPAIVYTISYVVKYSRRPVSDRPSSFVSYLTSRTAIAFSVLALLFHAIITKNVLFLFRCKEIVDANGNPQALLLVDTTIKCWQGEHAVWSVFVAIYFAVYCVGVPCVVGIAMVMRKQYFLQPQQNKLWGFLFMAYREEHMYFEMVVVLRKMALIAVIVFLAQNPTMQTYSAIWFVFAALGIVAQVLPYRNPRNGRLEQASLAAILFSLQVALLFLTEVGEDTTSAFAVIVSIMVYVLNGAVALWFAYALFTSKKKGKTKKVGGSTANGGTIAVSQSSSSLDSYSSDASDHSQSSEGSDVQTMMTAVAPSQGSTRPYTNGSHTPTSRGAIVGAAPDSNDQREFARQVQMEAICHDRLRAIRSKLQQQGFDVSSTTPESEQSLQGESRELWEEYQRLTTLLSASPVPSIMTSDPAQGKQNRVRDTRSRGSVSANMQASEEAADIGAVAAGADNDEKTIELIVVSSGDHRPIGDSPASSLTSHESVFNEQGQGPGSRDSTTPRSPKVANQPLIRPLLSSTDDHDMHSFVTPHSTRTRPADGTDTSRPQSQSGPSGILAASAPPRRPPPQLVSWVERVREDTDELQSLFSSLRNSTRKPPPDKTPPARPTRIPPLKGRGTQDKK